VSEAGAGSARQAGTEATAGWSDDEVRPAIVPTAIVPTAEFGSRQVSVPRPTVPLIGRDSTLQPGS